MWNTIFQVLYSSTGLQLHDTADVPKKKNKNQSQESGQVESIHDFFPDYRECASLPLNSSVHYAPFNFIIWQRMCWQTFYIFRGLLFIATGSWALHFLLLCRVRRTSLLALHGFPLASGLPLFLLDQHKHTVQEPQQKPSEDKQVRSLLISFYAAGEFHPISVSSCS